MSALNSSVLMLNKNYAPVWITTAKVAFIKLVSGTAEAVSIENGSYYTHDFTSWMEISEYKKIFDETYPHDEWVYTEKLALLVPRVIRCLNYIKVPNNEVKLTRKNVFLRDNYSCLYCGEKLRPRDLQLDHVIPESRGGKNTWGNLVCACFSCNSKKANRTPEEAGIKLIKKPYRPSFSPLFKAHVLNEKYSSWKSFLSDIYWNVELES